MVIESDFDVTFLLQKFTSLHLFNWEFHFIGNAVLLPISKIMELMNKRFSDHRLGLVGCSSLRFLLRKMQNWPPVCPRDHANHMIAAIRSVDVSMWCVILDIMLGIMQKLATKLASSFASYKMIRTTFKGKMNHTKQVYWSGILKLNFWLESTNKVPPQKNIWKIKFFFYDSDQNNVEICKVSVEV